MCCKATARCLEPLRQGGAGSLPVVLLLLIAASMVLVFANRALVFEIRSAANVVRASLALEAARAGIEWGTAALQSHPAVNATCYPDGAASATFIDQVLPIDLTDPQGRRRATTAAPGCVFQPGSGWQCQCPTTGRAALAPPAASDAPAPAFLLHFADAGQPGRAWLHSDGCRSADAPCGNGTTPSDANRRVSVLLGLLAALPRPPYATINALGAVQAEGDVHISHDHEAPGKTVASSSVITVDANVRLIGAPGQPGLTTTVSLDPRGLQPDGTPLTAERWFNTHFALASTAYKTLAHVHVLGCGNSCTSSDVRTALDAGHRTLWAEGNLLLDTTGTYGQPTDPVLLIAQGTLQITAALTLIGAAHAGAIDWQVSGASPGALQGTLNSASTLHLAGPLRLHRDERVITRLQHAQGTWAVAPGSWTDADD